MPSFNNCPPRNENIFPRHLTHYVSNFVITHDHYTAVIVHVSRQTNQPQLINCQNDQWVYTLISVSC